jgi:tetratricopeptide (TPR) repeat protein
MSSNPRSAQALYELALTLSLKDKDSEAMRLLMQATKLQPNFTAGTLAIANLYRKSDRLDDAVKIALQAVNANKENYDAALLLKDIYVDQGSFQSALNLMDDICNRRGKAEDFLALGHVASQCGDIPTAFRAYNWASTLAPDSWQPPLALAELFNSLGRDEEAEKAYKLALQRNRNSYEPHNSVAMYHIKHDHIEAAIKHLEQACKFAPEEPIAHYNLGLALAKGNRINEARESLAVALDYAAEGELHDRINRVLDAVDKELGLS